MRITIDDGELRADLEQLKTSIVDAAQEAGREKARYLMERLKQQVIDSIPDRGGWYDLYKSSIVINQISDDNYELTTTISEINYSSIDPETSLIWLTGSDEAGRLVAQHNPWTLDTLPAIDGGITGKLLVRPASPREVEHHRTERITELPGLAASLKTLGEKMLDFDSVLPKVNGRVVADVPFLAKRLEYGLGGFPRTPIWTNLVRDAEVLNNKTSTKNYAEGAFASRWWKGRSRNVGY